MQRKALTHCHSSLAYLLLASYGCEMVAKASSEDDLECEWSLG